MSISTRTAAVGLALALVLVGCSDDNPETVADQAQAAVDEASQRAWEAADALESAGEAAGAQAVAEALRAALKVEDLQGAGSVRDVTVLRQAVEDLPGEPEVTGIEDNDGDGRDDDGKVEVATGDQQACITLPDNGGDIDIANEAC